MIFASEVSLDFTNVLIAGRVYCIERVCIITFCLQFCFSNNVLSDLYPDNRFEILVDLTLINKGSLLEDMVSSSTNPASGDGVQSSDPKTGQHGRCAGFMMFAYELFIHHYSER